MQLYYDGKMSEENIMNIIEEIGEEILYNKENSLLFKSENLFALSTLLKSGYAGKIDLIYIDPPFNTGQKFVVSKNRSNTISQSLSGFLAYSDNLSRIQYLEFMRARLICLRELLSDEGSIYLHIDCKIGHYVKIIMDEIFGENSFINDISRVKSNPKNFGRRAYGNEKDMILFYAKNPRKNIWNNITEPLSEEEIVKRFQKIDSDGRRYTTIPVHAPGETKDGPTGGMWKGMYPPEGRHWRTHPDELDELDKKGLIEWSRTGNPRIKKFADEHRGKKIQDIWVFKDPQKPAYPTQKNIEMIDLIIKQSSNKDSIVLDCFAGSGTTLVSAQRNNRRWIGVDNSDFAINTIKTRLENSKYDYYNFESKINESRLPISN